MAGCSGSHDLPATSPNTSAASGSEAAIKQAFVDFFAGTTAAPDKIKLVERGSDFANVINRQAGTVIAKGTTATVSKVVMLSATQANVIYTVSLSGAPALKNVTGLAVKEGSTWKVSAQTFCTLLKLEQQAPPVCKTL